MRSLPSRGDHATSLPCSGTTVVTCENLDESEAFQRAWQDLADNAATPNVFLEPWHFSASLAAFGAQKNSVIVLIYHDTVGPKSERRLIGFIPLEADSPDAQLPGAVLSSWHHRNLSLCTPLLWRGFEAKAWAAFFDWARTSLYRNRIFELTRILAEGPVYLALIDQLYASSAIVALIEQSTRAQLERDATSPDQPLDGLSPGARKELRRQHRRLCELGHVEFRTLIAGEPVQVWIDQFLELEAAGWKREQGSALACNEQTAGFFRTVCLEGHRRGKLQMLGLFLDGRPIAMKCNFVTGDTGFTAKIAYDERYGAYSPGVLLELDMMQSFRRGSLPVRFDSCATPGHPMINRLWKHRRPIVGLAISPGNVWPNLKIGAYSVLRSIKRSLRSAGRR